MLTAHMVRLVLMLVSQMLRLVMNVLLMVAHMEKFIHMYLRRVHQGSWTLI